LCGKGHYSMRGVVIVESQAEFKVWLAKQTPQYVTANTAPAPAAPATGAPATPAGGAAKDSTASASNAIKTRN
jgi:cytochrome c oxidase subunit II